MNQAEVLNELKLTANLYAGKPYASKVVSLFSLIAVIQKLPGFILTFNGIKTGKELADALPEIDSQKYDKRWSAFREAEQAQDRAKEIFNLFQQWQLVTIKHDAGSYSFPFPVANKFYDTLAGMAGETVNKEPVAAPKVISTVVVSAGILPSLSTACKFISKDDLRPVMQQVCIAIENNKVEVVATDAHQLYQSKKLPAVQKARIEILVSEKDAKAISKIKTDEDTIEIKILKGDKIMIAGKIFDRFSGNKFPNYRVVIPKYKKYVEFDREDFVDTVKSVMIYANKSTNQVNLNINGQIVMTAQDVDFSFEGNAKMAYITKKIPDTLIGFNGKFLIQAVNTFKDKKVKMFTDGNPNRAGIFTNGIDSVLLMPLMLNN